MRTNQVLAATLVAASLIGIPGFHHTDGTLTLMDRAAACAEEGPAPQAQSQALARLFGKHYQPVKVDVKPAVPPYKLPLVSYDAIANGQLMNGPLQLGPDKPGRLLSAEERARREALLARGFLVRPWFGDDFAKGYGFLRKADIPIFITSDSILHLYHINFDETLREIEETMFSKDLEGMLRSLMGALQQKPRPTPSAEEKRAGAQAYAALEVAYDCLTLGAKVEKARQRQSTWFEYLDKECDAESGLLAAHAGFDKSPLFTYQEDYSQYIPRGHYTRSETLKRYFLTMMWLGRMTFVLKGGEPHGQGDPYLVSAAEARRQTLAGALIARAMQQAKLMDGRPAREVWERLYTVTAFYVGLSDDLTPVEYQAALEAVAGGDLAKLAGDEKLYQRFRARLALLRKPAIYSGTGNQMTVNPAALSGDPAPAELDKALDATQGLRVMGQRFVPDSYWMGKLVFPGVNAPANNRTDMFTCVPTAAGPARGFPRGLDVMALLGSSRADEVLKATGDSAYAGYDDRRKELAGELQKLAEPDWNANAYWSWLYALKPLLAPPGAGYPTFMQSPAWLDKQLNAALASWSQLRHDTILYVKQSYTMVGSGAPRPPKDLPGYVEPVPEFYARLLALARMTRVALTDLKALSKEGAARLEQSEKIIERLLAISTRELTYQPLTKEDEDFIKYIGWSLEEAVKGPGAAVPGERGMEASIETEVRTTLVADVHTDQNTQQVLEEGTGNMDLLIAVVRDPDGSLRLCAGPVFSAYEFKHPMRDRLTDEKWREMLKARPPARGPWTASYFVDKQ